MYGKKLANTQTKTFLYQKCRLGTGGVRSQGWDRVIVSIIGTTGWSEKGRRKANFSPLQPLSSEWLVRIFKSAMEPRRSRRQAAEEERKTHPRTSLLPTLDPVTRRRTEFRCVLSGVHLSPSLVALTHSSCRLCAAQRGAGKAPQRRMDREEIAAA